MSWKALKLERVIEVKKGKYITQKDSKEGPYPVILGGKEPAYYIDRFNHEGKAIVVSRSGASAGYVSFWDEPIFVTDGFLIEPKDEVSIEFLYYLMKMHEKQLQGLQGGSAIPHVTPRTIGAVNVLIPERDEQNRIVEKLSVYDDLIENNQKQIKLLEEAAQRLYKEWFVDLRFPGYEDVKNIDGVPNGWRNAQLGDVIDINKENISKNYSYDHIDYIDISSVRIGTILNTNFYTLADAPGRAKRCIHDGDVIWGMVRPNLKSYALIMNPTSTMIASTGFAVLTPKSIPFTFLYCLVTQEAFVGYLINCTNGAAYPAVKPIHFQQSPVLIPTDELLNQFHLITEPLFRKIDTLHLQINILTEARDRLLPKLMSGELEV